MPAQTHIKTGKRQTIIREGNSVIGQSTVVIRTTGGVAGSPGAPGTPGAPGPQGPPGPGGGGGGGSGQSYTQAVASNTWIVNHTMGFFPAVSTFDTTGAEIRGNVAHTSGTQVVVAFNVAVSGVTYLS